MLDYRLGFVDKLLLGGSLLGSIAFSYLLLNEDFIQSFSRSNRVHQEAVGVVAEAQNDVRRRLGGSLLMYKISSNETLYRNDTLYTGSESELQVALDNNINLDMGPNSMIILSKDENQLVLDLRLGNVVAKVRQGAKDFKVVQQGQVAKIAASKAEASTVNISRNKSGGLQLASVKGEVEVEINNKVNTITKSEALEIDQKLKVEKKKVEVELESPVGGEELWINPSDSIPFAWKVSDPKLNLTLEVSSDADFSDVISRESTSKTSHKVAQWPKEGRYHWRVLSGDSDKPLAFTPTSSFRVTHKKAPRPLFPYESLHLHSELEMAPQDKAKVRFEWVPKTGVEEYKIEVSEDEQFKKVVQEVKTEQAYANGVELHQGDFFWRVSASDHSPIRGLWSNAVPFKIGIPKKEAPPPVAETPAPPAALEPPPLPEIPQVPEPTTPAEPVKAPEPVKKVALGAPVPEKNEVSLTLKYLPGTTGREPASLAEKLVNPPVFKWKPVPQAKSYQFVLAKDPQFKSPLVTVESPTPLHTWKDVRPGSYFWKVRALAADEAMVNSGFSSPSKIQVLSPTPQLKPQWKFNQTVSDPSLLEKSQDPVKVNWSEVPLASKYQLMLSRESGDAQKPLETLTIDSPEATLALNESGNYLLKVAALNSKGEIISAYSSPSALQLQRDLSLKSPQIKVPANGITMITFAGQTEPVIFSWDRVPHARKYLLQFSRDKDFSQVFEQKEVTENQFILNPNFPSGTIYWRVQSQYERFASDWTKPRFFELMESN